MSFFTPDCIAREQLEGVSFIFVPVIVMTQVLKLADKTLNLTLAEKAQELKLVKKLWRKKK